MLDHLLGTNQFFVDLLGYARSHPHCGLRRWWSAERSSNSYAFGNQTPVRVIPDGHGIWTEGPNTIGWFLETDTGTEPLTRLVDKTERYASFTRAGGPPFPVLFWLHSAAREHRFHQRLGIPRSVPVATAARDQADGLGPAEAIWSVHGDAGRRRRLIELPAVLTPDRVEGILADATTFEW